MAHIKWSLAYIINKCFLISVTISQFKKEHHLPNLHDFVSKIKKNAGFFPIPSHPIRTVDSWLLTSPSAADWYPPLLFEQGGYGGWLVLFEVFGVQQGQDDQDITVNVNLEDLQVVRIDHPNLEAKQKAMNGRGPTTRSSEMILQLGIRPGWNYMLHLELSMSPKHPPWNFHYVLGGPEAPTNPIFVETSDLRGSTGPFSREVFFFLFSGFFFQPTL